MNLEIIFFKTENTGNSLVVQWLRLQTPKEGRLGSISGRGIRSHIPQPKILNAVTETWHSQINKYIHKNRGCFQWLFLYTVGISSFENSLQYLLGDLKVYLDLDIKSLFKSSAS